MILLLSSFVMIIQLDFKGHSVKAVFLKHINMVGSFKLYLFKAYQFQPSSVCMRCDPWDIDEKNTSGVFFFLGGGGFRYFSSGSGTTYII